jgi:hypothetical protein
VVWKDNLERFIDGSNLEGLTDGVSEGTIDGARKDSRWNVRPGIKVGQSEHLAQ